MTTSCSAQTVFNSVAAGYVAGSVGVVIGHPMDSAKVWLQTKGAVTPTSLCTSTPSSPLSSSSLSSGSAIANNVSSGFSRAPTTATTNSAANMSTLTVASPAQGRAGFLNLRSLRALYSGASGPLTTVGLLQSINFAIYDASRRILYKRQNPNTSSDLDYVHHDSLTNVAISAMAAGGILAVFTSPLQVIKTKQQIMEWSFRKAVSNTLCSSSSLSTGCSRLYVGFGPHCVAEVLGRGIYFSTYESLKRCLLETRPRNEQTVCVLERCASAAVAGIVCWSIIFPLDALRSRLYAQTLLVSSNSCVSPNSSWETARSMYREERSLRPFYRGFGVTVLRAGPVAAAVLPVYDTALEWLSRRTDR